MRETPLISGKLPNEMRQRIEDRAQERQAKEAAEKATLAIQQEALKDQQTESKAEEEPKNGATDVTEKEGTAAHKRPADASPAGSHQSASKRPRRKK